MPKTLSWYTIIAAFWMAFLAILIINLVGNAVIFGSPLEQEHKGPAKAGYPIEVAAEAATEGGGTAAAERTSSLPLIAAASLDEGASIFKKCGACHTAEAGGANKVGPNLHNIVNDDIGDRNGFKTTDSLKSIGGKWTYEKLDDYIENPKRLAPKGTMSFAGLKKAPERAAVIKYLMSVSENPPPVPAAAEAPAAK